MTTIREDILEATRALQAYSESPRIDAEILLAFAIQKPRLFLFSHPEYRPTDDESRQFQVLIQQRQIGWPIAYLVGRRDFWSFSLTVSPHTLIPRPETELLVERALSHLQAISHPRVLELGTGSGAIALAIATERSDAQITAVDISVDAIHVAEQNARALHIESVEFYPSDWFTQVQPQRFHLIISNPPYLAPDDPHLQEGDLRFEPPQALISESSGLDAIRHLIQEASRYLEPQGFLCLEHGHTQKAAIQSMFKASGYCCITTHADIQGHSRVTEARVC